MTRKSGTFVCLIWGSSSSVRQSCRQRCSGGCSTWPRWRHFPGRQSGRPCGSQGRACQRDAFQWNRHQPHCQADRTYRDRDPKSLTMPLPRKAQLGGYRSIQTTPASRAATQLMSLAFRKLALLSASSGRDACPSWLMQLARRTGKGTMPEA